MRLMSSRAHGMMDYPMGALMMSAPLLFKLRTKEISTWIPVAIGASTAIVSAMTDYEAGISRKIPFRTHLLIDVISGVTLAASPWIFRTRKTKWMPHLIFGIAELATVLLTRKENSDSSRNGSPRSSTARTRTKDAVSTRARSNSSRRPKKAGTAAA